jgi:hypothetical protein
MKQRKVGKEYESMNHNMFLFSFSVLVTTKNGSGLHTWGKFLIQLKFLFNVVVQVFIDEYEYVKDKQKNTGKM